MVRAPVREHAAAGGEIRPPIQICTLTDEKEKAQKKHVKIDDDNIHQNH